MKERVQKSVLSVRVDGDTGRAANRWAERASQSSALLEIADSGYSSGLGSTVSSLSLPPPFTLVKPGSLTIQAHHP